MFFLLKLLQTVVDARADFVKRTKLKAGIPPPHSVRVGFKMSFVVFVSLFKQLGERRDRGFPNRLI